MKQTVLKKILAVFLAIGMCFAILPIISFAEETPEIPEGYTPIYTKDDLDNIRIDMSGKYILMNDIIFTDEDYAPGGDFYNSGKGWSAIGTKDVPFMGTFNGNNHVISNLFINVPSENDIGLFGVVNYNAIIENTSLEDVVITANMNAGSIAGYSSAIIQNCSATGIIHTIETNSGGLVGFADHSTISECWFNGSVTSSGENAGGITGTSVYVTISKCQSYGQISSTLNAGGITGFVNTPGSITTYFVSSIGGTAKYEMCLNGAFVSGKNAGGIIGKNYLGFYWTYKPYTSSPNTAYYKDFTSSYTIIENCYNYGAITGEENAAGILGYHIYSTASYCDDAKIYSVTTINSCYSVGSISSSVLPEGSESVQATGGIVCSTGKKLNCSQYCYYLEEGVDGTNNDFGTAKSSDQLVKRSTYTDWDFDTIWSVDKYAEYPYPTLIQLEIPSFSTLCNHENTELQNASAATCTENGYTGDLVCLDCGETIEEGTVITALGHDYVDHPAQAPTCVAVGWSAYQTCSRCDYTSYEEIDVDATNHVNTVNVPETFSTCVTPGYTAGVYCNDCQQYISGHAEKALAAHTWNAGEVTATPTCTLTGTRLYTCTVAGCGETYEEELGVDPTNHVNTVDVPETFSTCVTPGYTAGVYCNDCKQYISGHAEKALVAHTWNAGEVTATPTCTLTGTRLYTCTVTGCGETYEEELGVDPTNHVNTVNVPETFSTCVTPGYTAGVYCNDCRQYISGHTEKVLADHTWNDGETLREATCNQKGLVKYTCTVAGCGETKTVETAIAPNNHNYVSAVTASTCTAQGYTTYTCTRCGDNYRSDYVGALGHSYTAVVTPATCTAAGYTTYTCVRGDHTYTADYTPALGHVDNNGDGYCDYGCGTTMTPGNPGDQGGQNSNACKYCGKVHPNTAAGRFMKFVHDLLFVFARLFGMR